MLKGARGGDGGRGTAERPGDDVGGPGAKGSPSLTAHPGDPGCSKASPHLGRGRGRFKWERRHACVSPSNIKPRGSFLSRDEAQQPADFRRLVPTPRRAALGLCWGLNSASPVLGTITHPQGP